MDESKIKSIIKLHIIDKQLNEINELRGELPEKIDIYTGKIEQLKNGLKENKKNFKILNKKQTEFKSELTDNADKINKLNDQIFKVKTNKEYDALLNEIDHLKNGNKSKNDELKIIESEVIKTQNSIDKNSESIEKFKSNLSESKRDLNKINKEIKDKEVNLLIDKKNHLKTVPNDMLILYNKKAEEFGLAFSLVNREACSNCFSSLPAQFIINSSNSNALQSCPTCNIFLYSEDIDNN